MTVYGIRPCGFYAPYRASEFFVRGIKVIIDDCTPKKDVLKLLPIIERANLCLPERKRTKTFSMVHLFTNLRNSPSCIMMYDDYSFGIGGSSFLLADPLRAEAATFHESAHSVFSYAVSNKSAKKIAKLRSALINAEVCNSPDIMLILTESTYVFEETGKQTNDGHPRDGIGELFASVSTNLSKFHSSVFAKLDSLMQIQKEAAAIMWQIAAAVVCEWKIGKFFPDEVYRKLGLPIPAAKEEVAPFEGT